jgi:cell division protein FtsZ
MRQSVDTLLIINNDKLREMFGNLTLGNAFSQADDVLTTAAKGIAEVISVTGAINVDFNDVNTVLRDSGYAIMGSAQAEGDERAIKAVQKALASPLLNDSNIAGAKYVLLNITYGDQEVLMDEIADITDFIQDEAGSTADVIWGHGYDETLGNNLSVTIIATGFNAKQDVGLSPKTIEKVKVSLDEERPTMITQPIENPISSPVENSINLFSNTIATPSLNVEVEPFMVKKEEVMGKIVENTVASFESTLTNSVEVKDLSSSEIISNEVTSELELPVAETENKLILEDLTTKEWDLLSSPNVVNTVEENTIQQEESTIKRSWLEDASENKVEETNESSITASNDGIIRHTLMDDEDENETPSHKSIIASSEESGITYSATNSSSQPSIENNADLTRQRIDRIRQNSLKMRTQNGLNELESEPAYMRRNIQLGETKLSSHSNLSRFSLNESEDENGNKKTGLSGNNSFLHDNVD